MLKRRIGLVVLVTLIALGVGFVVQAGDRKRARRIIGPVAGNAVAPLSDDVVTICPIYPMGGSGLCEWYAIKCINGQNAGPTSFVGACDLTPQFPCNNCYPTSIEQGPCETAYIGSDGFAGELTGPVTLPKKGSAKVAISSTESATLEYINVVHGNVIAKSEIPDGNGQKEVIYLQLISKTTKPQHPLDARIPGHDRMGTLTTQTGWQIQPQDKVDVEIDANHIRLLPGHTRVIVVSYQGDDYKVILKRK